MGAVHDKGRVIRDKVKFPPLTAAFSDKGGGTNSPYSTMKHRADSIQILRQYPLFRACTVDESMLRRFLDISWAGGSFCDASKLHHMTQFLVPVAA